MDNTLVIAFAAGIVSAVLFGVMVFLLAWLGSMAMKNRGPEAGAEAPKAPPIAPPAGAQARPVDSLAPASDAKVAPAAGAIGFFDDEATNSVPNLELQNELFQRSQVPASAFNSVPPGRFTDEEEEAEATEIFSASQLGSEFAEFLEEGEDASRHKEPGAS